MPAKSKPATTADFEGAFAALRAILLPYAKKLRVLHDTPKNYYLETHEALFRKKPLFFAGVRRGKNYVSFYLMPIYMNPPLQKTISPELKKHMQGKACFNFKSPDAELMAELQELTQEGARCFQSPKFLEGLQKWS